MVTIRDPILTGTTSACAENTARGWFFWPREWNYLRVRGEYRSEMTALIPCPELPPRARRILTTPDSKLGGYGTTSACAENTRRRGCQKRKNRNYLRVRGEYCPTKVW